MELKKEDLQRGIKASNSPYHCEKCNSTHRPGSKTWEEHLGFASTASLSRETRATAAVLEKRSEREKRKWEKKWISKERKELLQNYTKLLKQLKSRYYLHTVYSGGFHSPYGRTDGYSSLEELKRDNKYSFERMEKGEEIIIITKVVPFKVLKQREVVGWEGSKIEKKTHRRKKE